MALGLLMKDWSEASVRACFRREKFVAVPHNRKRNLIKVFNRQPQANAEAKHTVFPLAAGVRGSCFLPRFYSIPRVRLRLTVKRTEPVDDDKNSPQRHLTYTRMCDLLSH